ARTISIPVMAESVLPGLIAEVPDATGPTAEAGAVTIAPFVTTPGAAGWSLDLTPALFAIWAAGCAALVALFFLRQAAFRRRLGPLTADPQGAAVWFAETAEFGPMLVGFVSPR